MKKTIGLIRVRDKLIEEAREKKKRVRCRAAVFARRTDSRGPRLRNGLLCISYYYWKKAQLNHKKVSTELRCLCSLIARAERGAA